MFPSTLARPEIQPIADPGTIWELLENPDQPEPDRVCAAWRLAGARHLESVGRRLALVLREPTLWLGSEIVEVLRVVAPDLAFGVDGYGLVAVSPTPLSELVDRSCPVVGPVVDLEGLPLLAERLSETPPWLRPIELRDPLFVASRGCIGFGPILQGWPEAVHDEVRRRASDFPWYGVAVAPGDALELTNEYVYKPVGRVVALGGPWAGVLSYAGPQAQLVDVREDETGGDCGGGPFFRFYPWGGGWLAIRVRRP